MGIELIAVVVAGMAGAGVALLLVRTVRSLPRWLVPIAAGAAMFTTAIALEYGWYGRTVAGLPDRMEVVVTRENQAPFRPWTYVAPYIDGFVAVDTGSVRTNEAAPDQRLVDLLVFGRWVPVRRVPAIFDCAGGRRADVVEGVTFAEDGAVQGASWVETGLDDPVTRAACAGA
ncbi:hypothetical protein [Roseitranquillus sediminis]|uniref:hypothetical protein n=1 Tax=Roseitranquillus sediminis TaxID=2809051 RepID=UPI001D0C643E|nr:hypothetical protein [Roseitranquillus sediminis]MBM9596057.1 hypothetical protein [Roseitranquillus sediminis]